MPIIVVNMSWQVVVTERELSLFLSQNSFYNCSIMRKVLSTKLLIAFIFFCIGFLTNHLLVKFVHNSSAELTDVVAGADDRFPVNPNDFDHEKIMDTIKRMERGSEHGLESSMGSPSLIARREDEKFEYYDLPLKGQDGLNRKLNVEIKDGIVKVREVIKNQVEDSISESISERMISLDSMKLDINRAVVLNEKDKIVIKIPKKK